ncbi:MAG: HRDC domain-containing protein [Deinococcales bacterium]|jgi:hypothetical protein
MTNTRLVAYALIAIGLVALLSRLTGDSGWLWIGLVAAGFLVAYQRERVYSFLVLGSVLMGVAVGILLEGSWHWPGAFLVSLGAGVAAIDLAAPRDNRWPRIVGLGLIALGVITGLAEAGVLTSSAFAVLLIAAGIVLVVMSRRSPAVAPEAVPAGSAPEAAAGPGSAPPPAGTPSQEDTPPPHEGALRSGSAAPGAASVGSDEALRAALQTWRSQVAEAEGRSEALIVGDATLDEIVARRPGSLDELAEVHGIGPVKLERYGPAILERVRSA